MFSTNCTLLDSIAYTLLAYTSFKLALAIWKVVDIYFLGSTPNFNKLGEWSVITGSTDGIGLAYANKLAECGQKIVLISRSVEKLQATADKIEKQFDVDVKVITADFSSLSIYDKIQKELEGLDIGVLINNVGISYEYPNYFLDVENLSDVIMKMISVNTVSAIKMTEIVLPRLVAKKKGIILNVSSGSAAMPTPLLTLYSASKQFVDCFSKALNQEYKHKGIVVQCVMPFYVATKLSKIRHSSFFVPSPDKFASSSLKTIGKTSRSYGCFAHALQGMVFGLLPESLYMWVAARTNDGIRKKALRRKAAKKE